MTEPSDYARGWYAACLAIANEIERQGTIWAEGRKAGFRAEAVNRAARIAAFFHAPPPDPMAGPATADLDYDSVTLELEPEDHNVVQLFGGKS